MSEQVERTALTPRDFNSKNAPPKKIRKISFESFWESYITRELPFSNLRYLECYKSSRIENPQKLGWKWYFVGSV